MKERNEHNHFQPYSFEREDAIRQSGFFISRTRATKRRQDASSGSNQSSFSRHNIIRLNKGKKFLLQEQKNTQIERSNRILHEKLARCARRSTSNLKSAQLKNYNSLDHSPARKRNQKKSRKIKTIPTLPPIQQQNQKIGNSRYQSVSKSQIKQSMTLFMGHSKIDDVQFKIKIVIANSMYYLIAQNQHTKIVLEMPEEEYWALHYQEFQENPCKIFQYLVIEKGQINFRIKKQKQKQRKRSGLFQLPQGIKKRKGTKKSSQQHQKLPKI